VKALIAPFLEAFPGRAGIPALSVLIILTAVRIGRLLIPCASTCRHDVNHENKKDKFFHNIPQPGSLVINILPEYKFVSIYFLKKFSKGIFIVTP
jgi:hypothetical protein